MPAAPLASAMLAVLATLAVSSLHGTAFAEEQTAPAKPAVAKSAEEKPADDNRTEAKCAEGACLQASKEQEDNADEYATVRSKLALSRPFKYDGIPFHEALRRFALETNLDIVSNRLAAEHPNMTIHLVLERAPAKVALRQMLNQVDEQLDYAIRDGFVLIATRERLDKIHELRVYGDAVLPPLPSSLPPGRPYVPESAVDRVRLLLTVVQPQSWEPSGGQGRFAYANGNLVVWQTPRVHEQLADLFDELRQLNSSPKHQAKVRHYSTQAPPPPPAPSRPATITDLAPPPPQASLPLPAGPSRLEPARE